MNSSSTLSRLRPSYLPQIQQGWHDLQAARHESPRFLALHGPSGSGKLATVQEWCATALPHDTVVFTHGSKLTDGYLAGFYPWVLMVLHEAETQYPEVIQRHEQSLKRLFPFIPCTAYRVPKDLTNTASQSERTRFYHHEYQEKLLNGLYEFLLDYCQTTKTACTLVIDNVDQVSPTVLSFLRIIGRRATLLHYLTLILLFDQSPALSLAPYCQQIDFAPLDLPETQALLQASPPFATLPPRLIELYWMRAEGNIAKLGALLDSHALGIAVPQYLSFECCLDFYLSVRGDSYRYQLLHHYIRDHCVADDPVVLRNYQTYAAEVKAHLHREQIEQLSHTTTGEQYLRLVHYLGLKTPVDQVIALAPVTIKLQEIGLYDTWFDLFSQYYTDLNLRVLPDGDQLHNIAFIRMAFILYSLGLAKLSIPYLDLFYHHFPASLSTSTVLYSQSMTYGRYQIPVDLEKAEAYGLLNLEKIDTIFKDHPKYMYIKVFAENALAYIRARQGRFAEALDLCTLGIEKMSDIYGDQTYALHQSILVYNTGQIYELMNDFPQAYETYKHAIALDPYYGEYYNDLANLLQKYGHTAEALNNYQQAIDLCPPYYEAHLNRGGVYEDLGDLPAAEADYQRVIELKPDEARAYLRLGIIYLTQGRYEAALMMLDQAVYYNPRDGQAYNNRGLVYQALGRADEAAAEFDRALDLSPKLSEAYNNRAVLRFQAGHWQESLTDLNRAIALSADPDYLLNRGLLYQQQQRYEEALADFERAREQGGPAEPIDAAIHEIRQGSLTNN
jgi:tetratricopeptide (TPR) repeat protein